VAHFKKSIGRIPLGKSVIITSLWTFRGWKESPTEEPSNQLTLRNLHLPDNEGGDFGGDKLEDSFNIRSTRSHSPASLEKSLSGAGLLGMFGHILVQAHPSAVRSLPFHRA
jgi:hypothetical protein